MSHARRAEAFLADPDRAERHDAAIWHLRRRRDEAAARVPGWAELRHRAAEVRRRALAALPELLARFEARATELGARVHFARDAREHNRIVADLLAARGARRVVKSKSMLTEECGLNRHLESRGIEVVDTDLGERIVQLRGEPPSHLVMPAIHLRREEIGELFHRELGTPPGECDPARLVAAARRDLRRRFLAAEAGLSGVNFAVAETGGLVLCTNEGNADLGISLPALHIASCGIEKLVPAWEDLGVLLRVLARSATGQDQTVYTTHLHGPRPGAELHIVLVDNGRSGLLADPVLRDSLACIRCGACLNTCPVYRRSGGHSYAATLPGPVGSVVEAARAPARHASLPFACTLCGSCQEVCPVEIPLPRQLVSLRHAVRRAGAAPAAGHLALPLAAAVLRRPALFRRAAALARRMSPALAHLPERLRPQLLRGRRMPATSGPSFFERHPELRRAAPRADDTRTEVLDAVARALPAAGREEGPVAAPGAPSAGTPATAAPARGVAPSEELVERFAAGLARAGGELLRAPDDERARALLAALPCLGGDGPVFSASPSLHPGRGRLPGAGAPPAEVAAVRAALLPGRLAVAESGAVFVTDEGLPHRALPFLVEDLVLVVPASSLVPTLEDAYRCLRPSRPGFGCFVAGPSKTADIEQALVVGAHGPRSTRVLLLG